MAELPDEAVRRIGVKIVNTYGVWGKFVYTYLIYIRKYDYTYILLNVCA